MRILLVVAEKETSPELVLIVEDDREIPGLPAQQPQQTTPGRVELSFPQVQFSQFEIGCRGIQDTGFVPWEASETAHFCRRRYQASGNRPVSP